jgi:hypothetical protein
MKITISAELSQEYIDVIAKRKGYSDTEVVQQTISTPYPEAVLADGTIQPAGVATETVNVEVPNSKSKEVFIKELYYNMIVNDAISIFLSEAKAQRAEADRIEEETIRANVLSAINSTVE